MGGIYEQLSERLGDLAPMDTTPAQVWLHSEKLKLRERHFWQIAIKILPLPAHPSLPVCDYLQPLFEQVGDDRAARLHGLLLDHPQGEAQRDHAAHHRPEPRRLLQLDNAQEEAQERKPMSSRSKYCKWRNACVQSWYCQRVSLGLQHWRAHIFLHLCKCTCAIVQMYLCNCIFSIVQSYLCNPVTTVWAHVHARFEHVLVLSQ